MEMSENWFHFFLKLNFSLVVWSFEVGFCYETEAHLEFLVLLAQPSGCWIDCLNHVHPLGWNLIWFLKEQKGIWHLNVLRRPFEAGMETRIQGVPGHSWLWWWVGEVTSPLVGCQLQTSFCLVWFWSWQRWGLKWGYHVPLLWGTMSFATGRFRSCVDLQVLGRLTEASTQSSEGNSTSVALAYWVEILEREPSFLYSLQLMPNSWKLHSPQEWHQKVAFSTVPHGFSINEN